MKFHRLSVEDRDRLAVLHGQGWSLRAIARELSCSGSSLSRELRRNRSWDPWHNRWGYYPHKAQKQADHRSRIAHIRPRLKSRDIHQAVVERLERRWSPELIAGRLKHTHPELPSLSPETIYQWIYRHRPDLVRYLARAHPKRRRRWSALKRRVRIPQRISIQERPAVVQQRLEPGHWETDLIVGPGMSGLQVLVERHSRYTRLALVRSRTARICRISLAELLQTIPAHLRRSITYDNGAENYEHFLLNEYLGMRSFFCAPYHSWEKGTVENTNGLIRRFIPKQISLDPLTPGSIVQIENWLNDRPRKVLNFKTPREVFQALVLH